MITTFKAMKMSKNPVPLLSKYWSDISEYYVPRVYYTEDDDCLRWEDVWVPDNGNSTDDGPVDTVGLQPLSSSGIDSGFTNKGYSTVDPIYYKAPSCDTGTSCNLPEKYRNINHNNYFDLKPFLTKYEFQLTGGTFNLLYMVNFLYNQCHGNNLTMKDKDPTASKGQCAGYTGNAIDAGFRANKDLMTGHRGGANAGDACDKLGFTLLYYNPAQNGKKGAVYGSLPPHAYPGDICWQDTTKGNGGGSGHHCQIFTGKHWISDFLQKNKGIVHYKGGQLGTIYKYYRIPGIEQVYKPSGVSSSQVATSSSSGGHYERKCVEWKSGVESNGTFDVSGVVNYTESGPVPGVYDLQYLKDAYDRAKVLASLLRQAGANYPFAIGLICNANAETGIVAYTLSSNKTYALFDYKACQNSTGVYSGPWCAQVKTKKGTYAVNEEIVKYVKNYSNINGFYLNEFPVWAVVQGIRDYWKDKREGSKRRHNLNTQFANKHNQPQYDGKQSLWDYWQSCTDPEFITASINILWEWGDTKGGWGGRWPRDLVGHTGTACGPALLNTIAKW